MTYYQKWYKKNAAKVIAQKKKWKLDHLDQVKQFLSADGRLRAWKKRGISLTKVQYNQLVKQQSGCCKICGIAQSELKQKLAVDHDHKTNRIRGLLCPNCNRALGLFKDKPETLLVAAKYLS